MINLLIGGGGGGTKTWSAADMQNDINKSQDYIVCKMEALNGKTLDSIRQLMANDKLDAFNNAIQAFTDKIRGSCQKWSCLKHIKLGTPPSQRGGSCSVKQESPKKVIVLLINMIKRHQFLPLQPIIHPCENCDLILTPPHPTHIL